MGDLEQIEGDWDSRIKSGKNSQFDFAEDLEDQDNILKTITAFANSEGGDLLVGINAKSKIIGLSPESVLEELEELLSKNKLKEIVQYHTLYISHYILIRIQVFTSLNKQAVIHQEKKIFYLRVNEFNVKANKVILKFWRMSNMKEEDIQCNLFYNEALELLTLLRNQESLTLSKIYKKSSLKNKEVDLLLSCLLFQKKVSFFGLEGQIIFKRTKI